MSTGLSTLASFDSGMLDFKECVKHLRDGHPDEALADVQRALKTAPKNPFYLSYAGLLMARAERRYRDGERLCLEAIELRHNHPQLYLNLADVYQSAGQPQQAIEVLEKGLTSTGRHYRIRRTLKRLGRRRKPVLSFLDRSHPMNRVLGTLRHRLLGPVRAV